MARKPRECPAGVPQHLIHRGANRQFIFKNSADFDFYLTNLTSYCSDFDVHLHAWVLMSNHVHLLVIPKTDAGITSMMQRLAGSYANYFNKRYRNTGPIWEGRFRNVPVVNYSHLEQIKAYIEQNPLRAGLCGNVTEYQWSSGYSGRR
jgi:putative transposase